MSSRILRGDCIEQMATLDPDSIDAIVCDPPYGLEFMGKEWDRLDSGLPQENVWKGRRGKGGSNIGTDDTKPASRHHVALGAGKQHGFPRCQKCGKRQFSGSPCECPDPEFVLEYRQEAPSSSIRMQRWHEAWAREAYRILKPGGHLLAFGGTRTYHRLACAVEDAGFEIRDSLIWLYGSGFPKSLDVGKAIDRAAGGRSDGWDRDWRADPEAVARSHMTYAPATPEAEAWDGWGTALKPANEPVVVARKPAPEQDILAEIGSRLATAAVGASVPGATYASATQTDGPIPLRSIPSAARATLAAGPPTSSYPTSLAASRSGCGR